jgi:hypothetical protein
MLIISEKSIAQNCGFIFVFSGRKKPVECKSYTLSPTDCPYASKEHPRVCEALRQREDWQPGWDPGSRPSRRNGSGGPAYTHRMKQKKKPSAKSYPMIAILYFSPKKK